MPNSLVDYWEALDRLINGKAIRIPKNTAITNDAVSLEAGKSKGSIKKSRETFSALIRAIDEARIKADSSKQSKKTDLLKTEKNNVRYYKNLYLEAIEREAALVYENYKKDKEIMALKKQLAPREIYKKG